jgi:hypothetical protein
VPWQSSKALERQGARVSHGKALPFFPAGFVVVSYPPLRAPAPQVAVLRLLWHQLSGLLSDLFVDRKDWLAAWDHCLAWWVRGAQAGLARLARLLSLLCCRYCFSSTRARTSRLFFPVCTREARRKCGALCSGGYCSPIGR